MIKFSLNEAAEAVNAKLYNASSQIMVESVQSDSRSIKEGCLFVALKGEFFDGHDFAEQAYNKGAACILSHKPLGNDIPYILVEDTKYAFMDLAKWYLEKFNIPVVAITGSVGKTTTKDMTADILAQKYNVLKNEGNLNNEIGLPLTVFNIDNKTEIACLEMGMNSFGEIHNLSKIATPEVCVIINIGEAHIGMLKSKEGILKAKSEIFDFADKNAVAILNGDDDLLKGLSHKASKTLFFGTEEKAYCTAEKLEDLGLLGSMWRIYLEGENFPVSIPLPGDYLIYNAMAAICVGKHFGVSNSQIAEALKKFKPSKNRMDIFQLSGITFINDVYNANPISMKLMLNSLSKTEGRKLCILGDMLELGESSKSYHEEIGRFIALLGIDLPVFIGQNAKYYNKAFIESGGKDSLYFETLESSFEKIRGIFASGDICLIKASRGMAFEGIINELKRWF